MGVCRYVCVSNSAGYLRMTLYNATEARVEYVLASDSSVFDDFVVSADPGHAPFPNASTPPSQAKATRQ